MAYLDNNTGQWVASDGRRFGSQAEAMDHEDALLFGSTVTQGGPTAPAAPPQVPAPPPVRGPLPGENPYDYQQRLDQEAAARNEEYLGPVARERYAADQRQQARLWESGAARVNENPLSKYVVPVLGMGIGAGLGSTVGLGGAGASLGFGLGTNMNRQRDAANRGTAERNAQILSAPGYGVPGGAGGGSGAGTAGTAGLPPAELGGFAQGAPGVTPLDQVVPEQATNLEERRARSGESVDQFLERADSAASSRDTAASDQARRDQQEGLTMQRELFDELLGRDYTALASGLQDQALARMIAAARSAEGGVGARQFAQGQVAQQSPELLAQAQAQAEQARAQDLQLATGVARDFGALATGTRGLDEQRAQADYEGGMQVASHLAQLTGTQLQLDSSETVALGQLSSAVQGYNVDWANLSAAERRTYVDAILRREGLENNLAMVRLRERFAAEGREDQFVNGLIGAAVNTGAAALQTYLTS